MNTGAVSGRERGSRPTFGSAADAYARARPGYPAEALHWLVPTRVRRALDIGAGTGKLTEQLVQRGIEVVAVEPSRRMRAAFRNALPDVDVRAGTAENIPVGDSSVDALLCAQAWHWVNPSIAGPEVARVLRPGGIFGLVWNVRDRRHAWVDALARLLGPSGTIEPGETPDVGGAFGDLEHAEFTFVHTLPRNLVFDLVASRSQVVDLATSERSELLRSVEALVDAETETQGRTHITIPYRTLCFRAQKP